MSAKPVKWVAAGTSITKGNHVNPGEAYPELVAAELPVDLHNIGVPSSFLVGDPDGQGATADGLIDSSKLMILTLEFGVNDGTLYTAQQFADAEDAFVRARLVAGFQAVFSLTMLPCGSYDSVAFRAAINAYKKVSNAYVIDVGATNTEMGVETAKGDTSLYSDSVHPTALGYTKYYKTVKKALEDYYSTVKRVRYPSYRTVGKVAQQIPYDVTPKSARLLIKNRDKNIWPPS